MEETNDQDKKPEKSELPPLTAYNVKTKVKGCIIHDPVIRKTAKGAAMASGHDGAGNKLTTILSLEKAQKYIDAGLAKQDW